MTRKSIIFLVLAVLVASGLWAGGEQEQSLPFEQRYQSMSWEQIVGEARGQRLYWYMWGGSDLINRFVNGYVAERLMNEYDVTLEMVPVTDSTTFVNKVLGEKQARRDSGGSVDVMWINGENFRTMRDADLLFGPYADKLPNMQYIDSTDSSISNDFGFPVEGYESPYGSAQVVMVYDSARFGRNLLQAQSRSHLERSRISSNGFEQTPGNLPIPLSPISQALCLSDTFSTTLPGAMSSSLDHLTKSYLTGLRLSYGNCSTSLNRISGGREIPILRLTPCCRTCLPTARCTSM